MPAIYWNYRQGWKRCMESKKLVKLDFTKVYKNTQEVRHIEFQKSDRDV